jgi:hypothetical protein
VTCGLHRGPIGFANLLVSMQERVDCARFTGTGSDYDRESCRCPMGEMVRDGR